MTGLYPRVADVRQYFIDIHAEDQERFTPGNGTIELLGTSFMADEPAIFGEPNEDYIAREIAWYESQVPNIAAMKPPVPKIWQDVSGDDGQVNSQYGYLLYHRDNGMQYAMVRQTLIDNPASRQAVAIYTRPNIHSSNHHFGMKDFICTNAVNYFIRHGLLHAVVQMRSNDVVFGYRNDYAWQLHVMKKLADDLNVGVGTMIWQAASLHIYERHWHLLEA